MSDFECNYILRILDGPPSKQKFIHAVLLIMLKYNHPKSVHFVTNFCVWNHYPTVMDLLHSACVDVLPSRLSASDELLWIMKAHKINERKSSRTSNDRVPSAF